MKQIRSAFRTTKVLLAFVVSVSVVAGAAADDWPMWRADAARSGATSEQLPESLHLNWQRQLPATRPAWPEDPRIAFDASYQPIVVGTTMYVASSRSDSLTAYDTRGGKEKWRFYADGPIRFAPVAYQGHIYFGADDGHLYCLNAASGALVWKFDAAPSVRKVIGNERVISVWPVRGGPVLDNGKIHFTVGVWPFEGTFLYTLDVSKPATVGGKVVAPKAVVHTLNELTPQGYLALSDSKLMIPCGRDVASCFDQKSDKFLKRFRYATRGTDYHVSVMGRWLFHGSTSYDMQTKRNLSISAYRPVVTTEAVYFGSGGDVVAHDLANPKLVSKKDRRGRAINTVELPSLWRVKNDLRRKMSGKKYAEWVKNNPLQIDIKAGNRLYGHQNNKVFAVNLPDGNRKAAISWKADVEGTPTSMLAADGRLFVVTDQARIYCFGSGKQPSNTYELAISAPKALTDAATEATARILKATGAKNGYAILMEIGSGELAEQLLRKTNLNLIVLDRNPEYVDIMRRRFDRRGTYGSRVVFHAGSFASLRLPPYMANLIISEKPVAAGAFVKEMFHSLRPYGGTACLLTTEEEHASIARVVASDRLSNAELKREGPYTLLTRVGALSGSADWTHEYGDASNTLMSRDELVKAPLGVLWFGGPASSGKLFYNRHFWGPSMTVIGGRMLVQGPGKLTSVDIYTGRILWTIKLEENNKINEGRRGNNFEKVLSGFHYLAVEDAIYLIDGRKGCVRYDPVTGKQVSRFTLPDADSDWGRIRVKGDLLIAGVFREVKGALKNAIDKKLPVELIAINRHTGKVVWNKKAELSFPLVSISGDRVFCFDGAIENLYQDWKRKGLVPKAADLRYVRAFDLKTGNELWKYTTDTVVTWLGYSEENDVLMASNRKGMIAYRGADGKELWKKYSEGKGFKGHPENLWDRIIVWNDRVIDQRGPGMSYNIKTGDPIKRLHPITGKEVSWEFTKSGHHCNYAIASPHLLTFRASTAGFCDIETGQTSRLNGFRPGCRNSLIPAGGVLNAPNYAHGCSCGFSLFTSLALVHLPDSELWSYNALTLNSKTDEVERVGVNFGAPGDRVASSGTLWIDYPSVGGSSPAVRIQHSPKNVRWFRQHSTFIESGSQKWVAASGLEGEAMLTIGLGSKKKKNRAYTVRLHFADLDNSAPGRRVFDVLLQGRRVLRDFDVVKSAGGKNRAIVREFTGIQAGSDLKIELKATTGKPLLCGVEIVVEK